MSATLTYLDALDEPVEEDLDEEPRRPLHRTAPLYPTFGPQDGTGRDWRQFFDDLRAQHREPEVDEDDEVAVEPIVLDPFRLVDYSSGKGTPGSLARRLAKQGWDARVGESVALMPEVRYVNDSPEGTPAAKMHLKGDVRYEAHELTTTVLFAVKRAEGGFMAVEGTWYSKGGFAVARTYDPWLGDEIRVGYLKPRKPNQIELEEGVAPPLGLKAWVDLVAPAATGKKQPTKKTEEKEEASVWNG